MVYLYLTVATYLIAIFNTLLWVHTNLCSFWNWETKTFGQATKRLDQIQLPNGTSTWFNSAIPVPLYKHINQTSKHQYRRPPDNFAHHHLLSLLQPMVLMLHQSNFSCPYLTPDSVDLHISCGTATTVEKLLVKLIKTDRNMYRNMVDNKKQCY